MKFVWPYFHHQHIASTRMASAIRANLDGPEVSPETIERVRIGGAIREFFSVVRFASDTTLGDEMRRQAVGQALRIFFCAAARYDHDAEEAHRQERRTYDPAYAEGYEHGYEAALREHEL